MTDPVDLLALARETLAQDTKATAGPWRAVEHWFENEEGVIGHTEDSAADAEFIAHARTAAPLLAAEVVRLHEATCGTCKHWCQGKSEGDEMRAAYIANAPRWKASCAKVDDFREFLEIDIRGDCFVEGAEMDTPATFGCKFHEPR